MNKISLHDFADRLNEIIPVIMKEFAQRQENELYKGKISLPQFIILDFLEKNGLSRMTDLARFMKVTTAAMTGIIARLVKYGYVRRLPDVKDRRIIRAKVTVKGAKLARKVNAQRRKMIIDIFGKISKSERDDYLKILTHISEILTQKNAGKKNA